MQIEKVIKKLQELQKIHPGIRVTVAREYGDDLCDLKKIEEVTAYLETGGPRYPGYHDFVDEDLPDKEAYLKKYQKTKWPTCSKNVKNKEGKIKCQ